MEANRFDTVQGASRKVRNALGEYKAVEGRLGQKHVYWIKDSSESQARAVKITDFTSFCSYIIDCFCAWFSDDVNWVTTTQVETDAKKKLAGRVEQIRIDLPGADSTLKEDAPAIHAALQAKAIKTAGSKQQNLELAASLVVVLDILDENIARPLVEDIKAVRRAHDYAPTKVLGHDGSALVLLSRIDRKLAALVTSAGNPSEELEYVKNEFDRLTNEIHSDPESALANLESLMMVRNTLVKIANAGVFAGEIRNLVKYIDGTTLGGLTNQLRTIRADTKTMHSKALEEIAVTVKSLDASIEKIEARRVKSEQILERGMHLEPLNRNHIKRRFKGKKTRKFLKNIHTTFAKKQDDPKFRAKVQALYKEGKDAFAWNTSLTFKRIETIHLFCEARRKAQKAVANAAAALERQTNSRDTLAKHQAELRANASKAERKTKPLDTAIDYLSNSHHRTSLN